MEQAVTFKAFPHIGEKVLGYLTKENDFKSGFSVCKSWNKILKNPRFWLKKLKLNLPDEDKKWLNSTLELILMHFAFANKELSRSFQEKMFCLKKLKNPALEWKGFSDANIELAKSLRGQYFIIKESPKYFPICFYCKIDFRIHEHLANHLWSKSHIMKLELSGKLPIGTNAKMEQLRIDFNLIDTSSCDNFLESLKSLVAAI